MGLDAKGKMSENAKRVLAKRQQYAKAKEMTVINTVRPTVDPQAPLHFNPDRGRAPPCFPRVCRGPREAGKGPTERETSAEIAISLPSQEKHHPSDVLRSKTQLFSSIYISESPTTPSVDNYEEI